MQEFWNETRADTADALMIGWGRTELHSGASWDHVVVSFYGRSERSGIADAIQRLDGRDVVFFVLETDSRRFAGKVIDFQAERGFFLS
ncbi:hypothetical protein Q8W71_16375 [Methylobacterium sp. NEAU 140]|uniref:hypothetical protein n=1 Tax=Methylobacterium sp. NEAU 140 TaxID=3064945 RepID=UPI002732CEE9|nr:hypothetical protein [Methylobacterium sp. NEAU 140]MDP4024206.1 hypothetical protein [Methylobacterium sp. NEAU 140]